MSWPRDLWPVRLGAAFYTKENAPQGRGSSGYRVILIRSKPPLMANLRHNRAVNRRSVSALDPCAGKLCRWDITRTLHIGCNPASAHSNDGARAK
jgi:hypothetical protein